MSHRFPLFCVNGQVCSPPRWPSLSPITTRSWEGVRESLTWSQLYQRTRNLAERAEGLRVHGGARSSWRRRGLEYVVAFLASLEAGVIAVPLSTPMIGHHDERVTAVLADAAPSAIFTTSSIVDSVVPYAVAGDGRPAPVVLEVDRMDLDSRRKITRSREAKPETAYLQYTSGSTRTPAGVMVSTEICRRTMSR